MAPPPLNISKPADKRPRNGLTAEIRGLVIGLSGLLCLVVPSLLWAYTIVPGGEMCMDDVSYWTAYGASPDPFFGSDQEDCGANQGYPSSGCQLKLQPPINLNAYEGVCQQIEYSSFNISVDEVIAVRGRVLARGGGRGHIRVGVDPAGGTVRTATTVAWSNWDSTCLDGYQDLETQAVRSVTSNTQFTVFVDFEVTDDSSWSNGFCDEVQAERRAGPVFSFAQDQYLIPETQGPLECLVSCQPLPATGTCGVNFHILDMSAIHGIDYTAGYTETATGYIGALTFTSAGPMWLPVSLTIVNDPTPEQTEMLAITLVNPSVDTIIGTTAHTTVMIAGTMPTPTPMIYPMGIEAQAWRGYP